MAIQMVIFPASMVLPVGQTFTIRTFTWTTGIDGTVKVMEAVQAPPVPTKSTPAPADPILGLLSRSSSPATHRLLPRYQGRRLDNFNLIESIDRVTAGLAETPTLVESIRDQSAKDGYGPIHHHRTERPTQAGHQRRLDSDMVIMATPKG
jgi:hypothetical protein